MKLPEKFEIFQPGSTTPSFQTRLTPLLVSIRIISLVWRSMLGLAPACLWAICCVTSCVPGYRPLPSTQHCALIIPFPNYAISRLLSVCMLTLEFAYFWHCVYCLGKSDSFLSSPKNILFLAVLGPGRSLEVTWKGPYKNSHDKWLNGWMRKRMNEWCLNELILQQFLTEFNK